MTPEEKKKELDEVLAEVEKKEAKVRRPDRRCHRHQQGSSGSGRSSSSSASGGSEGKGEGGQSQGQGKGSGKGEGKGGSGNSQSKRAARKTARKMAGTADSIELKNELAKAQAQVQTEDLAANQIAQQTRARMRKLRRRRSPATIPISRAAAPKIPNQKGSAPMPVPQAGNNAANQDAVMARVPKPNTRRHRRRYASRRVSDCGEL